MKPRSVQCVDVDSYEIELVDCRQEGQIWCNLHLVRPHHHPPFLRHHMCLGVALMAGTELFVGLTVPVNQQSIVGVGNDDGGGAAVWVC